MTIFNNNGSEDLLAVLNAEFQDFLFTYAKVFFAKLKSLSFNMVEDVSEKPNSKGLLGGINPLTTKVPTSLGFVFGAFKFFLFIVGFLTIFFLLLNLLGGFNFIFSFILETGSGLIFLLLICELL